MAEFRISPAAQEDIDAILAMSEQRWGAAARERYADTMIAALRQIASDPTSVTSRERRTTRGVRSLHLQSVATSKLVRKPVHVVFYRVTAEAIEVVRVLHERMDVVSQLRPRRSKRTRR